MEKIVRPESMERITTPELAKNFIEEQIAEIKKQVGNKKVLLALSGGVDSSVVAALLIKAISKQLVCVHVNHGLLRKGEPEQVVKTAIKDMKKGKDVSICGFSVKAQVLAVKFLPHKTVMRVWLKQQKKD